MRRSDGVGAPVPEARVSSVASVKAAKVIHLVIGANIRMLGIVPSDVGQDIQRLGGVRSLPFPVALSIPLVGLLWATRHRDPSCEA